LLVSGPQWRAVVAARTLRYEIALALVFKALALAIFYFAFFDGAHRIVVSPRAAMNSLFQSHSTFKK
jgi:hypothetical protein